MFDIGTLPGGAPSFVMDRLEGETLAARLGRERFSAAAVDLTMQLLSAMDAVHERHLVLRDVRPQNVFLAQRRGSRPVVKVKLLDVGLARLTPLETVQREWEALRAVTSASDVSGLLAVPCSSRRSARDEHDGPSSDLFVAGIILHEALTGQKPFAATSLLPPAGVDRPRQSRPVHHPLWVLDQGAWAQLVENP